MNDALTKVAYRRDDRTSAKLDHHRPAYAGTSLHVLFLLGLPSLHPLKIRNISTLGRARPPHCGQIGIAFNNKHCSRSTSGMSYPPTKPLHNRAQGIADGELSRDTLASRTRQSLFFLELPVDIAGEHGATQRHVFTPSIQYPESDMRLRFTIQLEAMPVKTPCSLRLGAEGFGAGNAVEINLLPPKRWVRLPKSVFASKVRAAQSRRLFPRLRQSEHRPVR